MIQITELIAWQTSKLSTQIWEKLFHNFFILVKLIWLLIKSLPFFKPSNPGQKTERNKTTECFFSFTKANVPLLEVTSFLKVTVWLVKLWNILVLRVKKCAFFHDLTTKYITKNFKLKHYSAEINSFPVFQLFNFDAVNDEVLCCNNKPFSF